MIDGIAPGDGDLLAAVQVALASEHAAVWAYGLASAYLPPSRAPAIEQALAAHAARRDGARRLLREAGAVPVVNEPSYTAGPVTDAGSATLLVISAENDVAQTWRAVLERTDDRAVRAAALEALTDATVRMARWRITIGRTPAAPAFPGQPASR